MTAFVHSRLLGRSKWFVAFANWRRVIWLAMCQVTIGFSRKNRMGLVWAMAEPLVLITLFYAIRLMLRMRTPDYGPSLFLFLATGFLPFYLFIRLSTQVRIAGVDPANRLPGLSALDAYIARVLVNAVIWITMMVAVFLGIWWIGGIDEVATIDVFTCAVPILLLIGLAMGVGMLNSAVSRYVPFWNILFSLATRGLMFLSGVVQIIDLQPWSIRQYSIINPLSHAIEWFRIGVWERYPHNSLDKNYFIAWVVVCLFLGMVTDRASLRTLSRVR